MVSSVINKGYKRAVIRTASDTHIYKRKKLYFLVSRYRDYVLIKTQKAFKDI